MTGNMCVGDIKCSYLIYFMILLLIGWKDTIYLHIPIHGTQSLHTLLTIVIKNFSHNIENFTSLLVVKCKILI